MTTIRKLSPGFFLAIRHRAVRPTRLVLQVSVLEQRMWLFEAARGAALAEGVFPYVCRREYLISTSAFGVGQQMNSNKTPLGLHRVARKIGAGWPQGAVFRSRRMIGYTWGGLADASIVHRILWLEGLEPGFNCGGNVDTFRRYIYIHGFSDETTLGRPCSHGCIHVAAADLLPLFDRLPIGTLVWIFAGCSPRRFSPDYGSSST